jgi:UV DNA damage endonuclease
MPKRKRSSIAQTTATTDLRLTASTQPVPGRGVRRASTRAQPAPATIDANPNTNAAIEDAQSALRTFPDAVKANKGLPKKRKTGGPTTPKQHVKEEDDDSPLSELEDADELLTATEPAAKPTSTKKNVTPPTSISQVDNLEGKVQEDAEPHEIQEALSRPPPVNSSYLPLPWKGRLGYACLNTYLRAAHIPVFSSRTCRIASILEHRHPLKDPTQPEHATKNRPDKEQPADVARGQAYVEALGLANACDIPKMLRWNERYGIKFLRLSSEMFPFASHDVYGYKLSSFASEALAEAGSVAADLGHRLTTHPGQFTQLGSPRKEVITASIRDLEYHCELLDLLKLPPQQDRDAVMILHMGGIFGDKAATLNRFRENYAQLSPSIKKRLVLENDDVCYSVHDLLPICEELNIPLVLDYHHHNLIFDADKVREGTLDIMDLYDRIKATWIRKNITQKMHYSEPTPAAITVRQRRKHNPRVATLPPCAADMDLMIEAKDKEQAVFELMRTFKLPGYDTFNDILPHVRNDENRPWKPPKKKTPKKKKSEDDVDEEPEPRPPPIVPEEEVSMGGAEGRVYWPPGMEEWLRPKKREVKPRDPAKALSTAEKAAQRRAEKAAWQASQEASNAHGAMTQSREVSASVSANDLASVAPKLELDKTKSVYNKAKVSKAKPARAPSSATKKKNVKGVPTPSASEDDPEEDEEMPDMTDAEETAAPVKAAAKAKQAVTAAKKAMGRSTGRRKQAVNYAEDDED